MKIELYLDGVKVPKEQYDMGGLSMDSESSKKDALTSITFRGTSYQKVFDVLVNTDFGILTQIPVKMYYVFSESKKELILQGVIRSDALSYCYEVCEIEVDVFENTTKSDFLDYIDTTLLHQLPKVVSTNHPKIEYANQLNPRFIHDLALILGVVVFCISIPLLAVISLVFAIAGFLNNVLSSVFNIPNVVQELNLIKEFYTEIKEFVADVGKKHPAPYIRTILEGIAEATGVSVQSTIFLNPNSPYYNAVYTAAQSKEGIDDNDFIGVIEGNLPIKTLKEFLNDILPNVEWKLLRIANNDVLVVERKDYFYDNFSYELGYSSLPNISVCFSSPDEQPPAYNVIRSTADAVNIIGQESEEDYTHYTEWNAPPSKTQKGVQETILPYTSIRQVGDKYSTTVYERYDIIWSFFGKNQSSFQELLLLNNGQCFAPMYLDYDPNTKKIKNYNEIFFSENIYTNFVSIDNPRTNRIKYSVNVSFDLCYGFMDLMKEQRVFTLKMPDSKIIKITSININFESSKVNMTGYI